MSDIDTTNDHLVGVQGDRIVMLMPPLGPISKAQALRLAAWLVVLADYDGGGEWERVFEAVCET